MGSLVGQKYSDAGYGWVFPLSENRVRIGVGVGRPESNTDPLAKIEFNNRQETETIGQDG